jgi:hypothetical protein|tara:strand:- start:1623 stop:1919 length:297 start_codon:yes stop_codon:yes gene_type:complete
MHARSGELQHMIKEFGTLYAGHIDFNNIGFGGIAANNRLFPNEELIVEKLMPLQDLYPGPEFVNAGAVIGTPQSVILEQLEQFSTEVIPHFTGVEAGA